MACFRILVFVFVLANLLPAQRTISFSTADGGLIYADTYGSGQHAVVLAHGGRFDRKSWNRQANFLADHGFIALAIDFRGEGQSRSDSQQHEDDSGRYLDILGAVHYLKRTGASSVSVIGASMG